MDRGIFLGYVLPVGLIAIGIVAALWINRRSRIFDEREVLQKQIRSAAKTGNFIHFDNEMMWLVLPDGIQQGIPLRNYQWLLQADLEARRKYSIDGTDIRWDALNKKIGMDEIFDMTATWKFKTATW